MDNSLPITEIDDHRAAMKAALRAVGVPKKVISAIETRALRTGRKITGQFATNRDPRWELSPDHPQYGTERDCKIILVKLTAQIFCFDNAPLMPSALSRVSNAVKAIAPQLKEICERHYLGHEIKSNSFRDALLLERFDFHDLVAEGFDPVHGHSSFHIGHEDPTRKPKHTPDNVAWRTKRSNLIQGNMTLRQSRIYFVKLIARYFELGELHVDGELADSTPIAESSPPDAV
jgi:hypothetical protein